MVLKSIDLRNQRQARVKIVRDTSSGIRKKRQKNEHGRLFYNGGEWGKGHREGEESMLAKIMDREGVDALGAQKKSLGKVQLVKKKEGLNLKQLRPERVVALGGQGTSHHLHSLMQLSHAGKGFSGGLRDKDHGDEKKKKKNISLSRRGETDGGSDWRGFGQHQSEEKRKHVQLTSVGKNFRRK